MILHKNWLLKEALTKTIDTRNKHMAFKKLRTKDNYLMLK